MSRQPLNPSLHDRDIIAYLIGLGVDIKLFDRFVRADIPATKYGLFFKKPNGETWSRHTFNYWVKVYKEQIIEQSKA